jgi:hypothetical protein
MEAQLGFEWFDIEADPVGWDRQVRETQQSLFHLSALLAAHAFGGARRRGVLIYEGEQRVALIGGLLKSRDKRLAFESLSFPSASVTGRPALVRELMDWLVAQGIQDVSFGSYDGGVETYELPEVRCGLKERLEFLWSLSGAPDTRLRSVRSNHKRKLQKLLKQRLELREITRWQPELLSWMRVQWARRRGQTWSLAQIFDMYRYHRYIYKSLRAGNVARLYGLYSEDGTLLSLAYMLETDGMAFYMIGASSPAGYQINGSLRLFWDLAEGYAARGYKWLHLGGVPRDAATEGHDEHGTFRFKSGFGIEPQGRTSLSFSK